MLNETDQHCMMKIILVVGLYKYAIAAITITKLSFKCNKITFENCALRGGEASRLDPENAAGLTREGLRETGGDGVTDSSFADSAE